MHHFCLPPCCCDRPPETAQVSIYFFFALSFSSQSPGLGLDDGKFPEAVRVLLTWLERGEVNRRNANNFYSMIQSSNGHIRRLTTEKSQHEKEMEEAKEKFKTALAGIVGQCEFRSMYCNRKGFLCVEQWLLRKTHTHTHTHYKVYY